MKTNMLMNCLGIDPIPCSQHEKLLSAIGGCIGISLVYSLSSWLLGPAASLYIIPSMGASAVLLFAAPHSPLAQPWNLVAGHLISALVGVCCARLFEDVGLAAALAVGVAIGAMYYLRCIHPPGGATALAAVIGGPAIQQLGFVYVFNPVLINTLIILAVALLFNFLFAWRRYPACLVAHKKDYDPINHADLVYALSEIDSFVDVSENDLLRIYRLATGREVKTTPGEERNRD